MADPRGTPGTSSPQFHSPETLSTQFLAGAGFALIYALTQPYPPMSCVSVLALLPCILRRLDERQRKLGQAPLTLAALMLTLKVFTAQANGALFAGIAGLPFGPNYGALAAPWLPLFIAVPLFYMPDGVSHSRKVFLGLGILVLCSGLLPGNGFGMVFLVLQYVLFFAVAWGIVLDLFTSIPVKTLPSRP